MSTELNRAEKLGRGLHLEGRVLITGGTGSLGQAIVRRARREGWPCDITILSRDEVKQSEMRAVHPQCRYVLGDVRDLEGLLVAFQRQDVVIHAGAYKQVPSAEVNAYETIRTNVCGSCNVAMAAVRCGVKQVVGISTDKACMPINCYGKSKALMETIFQQANAWGQTWGQTRFHLTRYGNVVGSRGSIIPLFQRQAAKGGPLTVTDRRMTRFWLTLQEAVDLILLAFAEREPGTIVVPKLPSMRIVDLAEAIGPGQPVRDVGIRPGEKLDECLLHQGEALHAEDCGEFYRVHPAASGYRGDLPDGFEYRTDTNDLWISIPGMRKLICECEEEEHV